MKVSSMIAILLQGSTYGTTMKLGRSGRGRDFRGALAGAVSTVAHTIRRNLLQDESTFYAIILSGATSLSEVNTLLKNQDPHFAELSQNELDALVDQWLFQMLAK